MAAQILPTMTGVLQHYPTLLVQGCALACAIPTLEMALCAIRDVGRLHNGDNTPDLAYDLSGELAGAVTLGILAANLFPYSTPIGAAGFTVYSLYVGRRPSSYQCSQAIYEFADSCIKPILSPIIEKICQAVEWVWDEIIVPTATFLKEIAATVFNRIPLPKHPAWYFAATATVVAALAITGHLPNIRLQSPIVIVR